MDKSTTETILKHYRLKVTPARRALLRLFERNHKPVNSQDLIKKMQHLGVDQATVYRNVETLEKVGLLKKVMIDDTRAHYELNHGHHHHHLVCNNCEKIEDIEINDHEWIEHKLKDKKFTVLNHSFEFFGLCQDCAK